MWLIILHHNQGGIRMPNLEINLRLSNVDVSKVEAVWNMIKKLQKEEKKLEIISFKFSE